MPRHDCIRFCVDILKVAIILLTYSGDIQELILTDKSTIVCFTKDTNKLVQVSYKTSIALLIEV